MNANPSVQAEPVFGRLRLASPLTAVVLGGLVLLLVATAVALMLLTRDFRAANDGLALVLMLVFAAVGVVIARRQPRNPVGWLLIAVALLQLFTSVSKLYLVLDYRLHSGDLPLGPVAVYWVGAQVLFPFLFIAPLVLLFPDGRVPSRRWRWLLRAYLALAGFFILAQLVGQATVPVGPHPQITIQGKPTITDSTLIAAIGWLLSPLFAVFWVAFLAHQTASWRHTSGERRQQLKWLISGAGICLLGLFGAVWFSGELSASGRLLTGLCLLAIGALPVSIGIAILKYRLYEIDRLISRTLSYAILTGLLAGVFVGIVVLATDVLPFSSPVGVAASTLAAAGLFNPLRQRVQRLVDRRFNRARYDAEATVAAFTARLRDAVDLDTIRGELLHAVEDAVQPVQVSVWIKPTGTRSRA